MIEARRRDAILSAADKTALGVSEPFVASHLTATDTYDRLLDEIWPRLNALHESSHSRRFWQIMLYRFLWKCMIVEGGEALRRTPPPSVASDESVFGARVGDEAIEQETRKPLVDGRGTRRSLTTLSRVVRSWRPRLAPSQPWTSIGASRSLLTGFHSYEVVEREVTQPAIRLRSTHMQTDVREVVSARKQLAKGTDWPLARLALEWMPRWYVEEFQSRYEGVRLDDPERREFHASFLSSVGARFFIARYVEEGATLTLYQHAATYGEVEDHVLHHAESGIADRFRTWGWAISPNDQPFLALRLIRPQAQRIHHDIGSNRRLYVNVRQPFAWLIGVTLSLQERFFSALGHQRAGQFTIRARTNKGGAASAQVCELARRSVAGVDDGREPWPIFADGAELVVLDSFPSTVFMECLVAGLPVIAIVPDATRFTELAADFYRQFQDVGVLHRSPESAAAFIKDLDVSRWWRAVEAQPWMSDYRRTFCRTVE